MPPGNYRVIAVGKQMGIGVAGSQQIDISAVAKANGPNAPYCVPNEWICVRIGQFLGLPIPPAGIVHPTAGAVGPLFASLDFNLTGVSLPAVDPATCVATFPDLCTGVLLFDILIANCDRNRGNLSADMLAKPPQMNVFDHSHALYGYHAGKGKERLENLGTGLGVSWWDGPTEFRHCLLDVLANDDYFGKWIERIGLIPNFLVEEACHEMIGFGITADEATTGSNILKQRRDDFPNLIKTNKAEFRGIALWSLFI